MTDEQNSFLFDIVRSIGHGGQADVYLLRNRASGSVFAGKFLREAWDPFAREQFRNEAERQARVAGRNVVPIVAWNLEAERPFVVLEFMPHGSLADEIMRRGRLPPRDALVATRAIAVALAELHSRGVVHRDLKPGNILRAADGRLVLNDLGIAATMTFSEYVRASGFVGTPAYAAPEQHYGIASPKSDVYALGIVLQELVTGSPVIGPRSAVPEHMRGLVLRLTRQVPDERPTAFEAVQLVDAALREPDRAFAASHAGSFVAPLVVGGLALAAVALFSGGGKTWDPTMGRYRDSKGRFA